MEKPKREKPRRSTNPRKQNQYDEGEYNKILGGNDLETFFVWPTVVELLTLTLLVFLSYTVTEASTFSSYVTTNDTILIKFSLVIYI